MSGGSSKSVEAVRVMIEAEITAKRQWGEDMIKRLDEMKAEVVASVKSTEENLGSISKHLLPLAKRRSTEGFVSTAPKRLPSIGEPHSLGKSSLFSGGKLGLWLVCRQGQGWFVVSVGVDLWSGLGLGLGSG